MLIMKWIWNSPSSVIQEVVSRMTALVTLEVVGPVLLVVLRVPPVWALGVNSHKLHGSPLCLPTSTAASLVTNGSVCVCVCVYECERVPFHPIRPLGCRSVSRSSSLWISRNTRTTERGESNCRMKHFKPCERVTRQAALPSFSETP